MRGSRTIAERRFGPSGIAFALAAAVLFGLATPFAKILVGSIAPVMMAGLLYLGSGGGLLLLRAMRGGAGREASLSRRDLPFLAGVVIAGGVLGPLLLMWGLRGSAAFVTSLLLNLEGVFTALLAWFVFHENFDRRVATGMAAIVAGGVVLSWSGGGSTSPLATAAVVGACLCWAIDNNLTQKISAADPLQVAAVKGAVAGAVNLTIGLVAGSRMPAVDRLAGAVLVGFLGYGVSLTLFVLALRHLGTARTGAYFSVAPFVGALASIVVLHEPATTRLLAGGALMAAGVWLHLTERHEHEHSHEPLTHTHRHVHDEHHRHVHEPGNDLRAPHTHEHTHEPLTHGHPHYPDLHHRHRHGGS
jgi:drug/metabolite transporter (DMT)-like permease